MTIEKKDLDIINQFVDELIKLNESKLKTNKDKQDFLKYIQKNFDSLFTKYIDSQLNFVKQVKNDKNLSNRILNTVYKSSFGSL